jgi:hypothetical protein
MILYPPELVRENSFTIAWAKVELDKKRENFPEYLWYRVPEVYGSYFSSQSDAFLVAALLAAMHYGEDIRVCGTVSPRLAYHLDEYQFVLHIREPHILNRVKIDYQSLEPQEIKASAVGATFSGGVDSLFTLWRHLPQNQPDPGYQITDVIFILGFDILPTENENYRQLYRRYAEQLSRIGVKLIPLETNMVSVTHTRLNLSYMYGPLIASAGLALQAGFRRFFIPSSWDYYNLKIKPHNSDPLVDGFLSTDTLDVIHHGSTYRRVEKVEQIANWELAQKTLWVCQEAKFEAGTWNCSRCEKCVRTMIPLYALGKLDQFKTFEKPFKKDSDGLWWARKFSLVHNFVSEMFPFVKKHKPDFLPWLYLAAALGNIRYYSIKFMPGFVKHWLRRYGYFVTRNEAPDAYENPQITKLIRLHDDHPPS